MYPIYVSAKFEVRSFTHSWDNRRYLKTLDSPWLRTRFFFSRIFNGLFFGWTLWMYRPNLKSVALPVPGIIGATLGSPWIRRSRSFKVTDFGTNRKRVCDFLLVRHSNLGRILHRFGDIAGFCAPEWPRSYSTPILGVFPLHQIAHVRVTPGQPAHIGLMLFGREIIFID